MLRDRKLNIAPAIKKQSVCTTNGAIYYAATPPTPMSNMPIDQFAAVYPPGKVNLFFLKKLKVIEMFDSVKSALFKLELPFLSLELAKRFPRKDTIFKGNCLKSYRLVLQNTFKYSKTA